MTGADHYAALGVPRSADSAEIKSAYRKLARKYHPDIAPNGAARFRQINEAHATLSDPAKRAAYDSQMDPPPSPNLSVENPYIATAQLWARRVGTALMGLVFTMTAVILILQFAGIIPKH